MSTSDSAPGPKDPSDDLFDLPSETLDAVWRESDGDFSASMDLELDTPPAPLPKPAKVEPAPTKAEPAARTAPPAASASAARTSAPSGAPAPAPAPAAAAEDADAEEEPTEEHGAEIDSDGGGTALKRLVRHVWIAFGVLAAVNVVVLGISLTSGAPATDARSGEATAPAPAAGAAAPWTPPAIEAVADSPMVAAARAALRAAETDLAAGRRAAARARIGRMLLSIDLVEPERREELRAQAAILGARCAQADVEAARRTAR